MLSEIRIRGLGVISDAVMQFCPGLTVVTGETGAGKTMVVSGLALLFGGRADLSRLRAGYESASVEGRLLLSSDSSPAQLVVDAGGDLEHGEDGRSELILRRVLSAGGRSRAVAGGAAVPAALLAKLASELVVVHGQSDQLRLTLPAEQRATLDRYAGLSVSACRDAFTHWQDAERVLAERQSGSRELVREAEMLRTGLAEIAAVAPERGEDAELAVRSARLEHADGLRAAALLAHDALAGSADLADTGATDLQTVLSGARRALEQVSGTDPKLDELSLRVAALSNDAADIAAELASYQNNIDADPDELARVFARRAVLAGVIRKYGTDIAAVLAWAEQAEQRLAETDTSEGTLAHLAELRDTAAEHYAVHARALSERRRAAAAELSERITAELAGLAMPAARVDFTLAHRPPVSGQPQLSLAAPAGALRGARATSGKRVAAGKTVAPAVRSSTESAAQSSTESAVPSSTEPQLVGAGPDGFDDVELTLTPHPDAPALPVQRGASGGELSRVMLAIEVVLAGSDPVPTMIFDEVDSGVGGRAATEIGRRLATLARSHQVIVVTHLAQVAAYADRHLVVDKQILDQSATEAGAAVDGSTVSAIRAVSGKERLTELARMLAGNDSALGRRHAAELLANAQAETSTT